MARARKRRTGSDTAQRLRRRGRMGATLMASSLVAGTVLATLAPAAAQEASEGPAPDETQPIEVQATAYYTYPVGDALPPTLTSEFPPGVICIVAPELCPESLAPISDGVEGGISGVKDNEPNPPADPLPPGDLPVGVLGGADHYESAVKFELPAVPSGEEIESFVVVLPETPLTYHTSSPAFRQAVLAVLTCARECDQDQFSKILEQEPVESAVIGVEACPFTEAFTEGPSQTPPEQQPVDCLYGANAQRLDDGRWAVDLTFAAQAWADGSLDNHGVLLRSTGAPNLAYGDADPTTTAQVTYAPDLAAALDTMAVREDPGTTGTDTGNDSGTDTGTGSGGFSGDDGDGFSSAPSGGVSGDPFSAPPSATPDESAVAPEVAAPGSGDTAAGSQQTATAPVAGVTDEPVGSAWWIWLLVPLFAAGSWMTAQSLTAETAMMAGRERSGAMTRLIARNHEQAASASPMTQV